MFISSLAVLAGAPVALAQDSDPPLAVIEPTSSPATSQDAETDERDGPPLAIVEPVPSPGVDRDDADQELFEEAGCADDYDDECVIESERTRDRRDHRRRGQLLGQYALQFIGRTPSHQFMLRRYTKNDAYFGAELRYLPGNDAILWSGRAGAGIDVLGGGRFDLQLGLFVGSAGEWFYRAERPLIYHSPIFGTEVRFAYDGRYVFTSYRWLGGIGTGPLQRFLSEREFILGYKVTPRLQVFGQSVRIDPRSGESQWSLGLGGRIVL